MPSDRLYKLEGIIIPKKESVTSWAEAHHYLKRTGGYLSYKKYPFMREPKRQAYRASCAIAWHAVYPFQTFSKTIIVMYEMSQNKISARTYARFKWL